MGRRNRPQVILRSRAMDRGGTGEEQHTRYFSPLLLLPLLLFLVSPSIDRRRLKLIVDGRFRRHCPVASDPRIGQLADRYVLLGKANLASN
ncbi:hypothetical protein B296_00053359 [Ensete ventricosum]|uniref:Uncharacterized protein n=1 Tax=Ensete ventricosum TaxID=4639 RepID=A0A426XIB8_ENSVE|nr:hypothetical protein B296_00053359 [Ensete ventricosum]